MINHQHPLQEETLPAPVYEERASGSNQAVEGRLGLHRYDDRDACQYRNGPNGDHLHGAEGTATARCLTSRSCSRRSTLCSAASTYVTPPHTWSSCITCFIFRWTASLPAALLNCLHRCDIEAHAARCTRHNAFEYCRALVFRC
jgi:hypothetical protein